MSTNDVIELKRMNVCNLQHVFDIFIYRESQKLVVRDGRSYAPHVPLICASKDDFFACQVLPHELEGFLTIVSIKN